MKKLKAIFSSIILTLFVLNNLMPIITYAGDDTSAGNTTDTSGQTETTQESTEQEEIGRVYEIKDEETWDVSKDGDGSVIAKWILSNKTLTISGSGEMKAWTYSSEEDWHGTKYQNAIEKVIIEDGITNTGRYAFVECRSLTNIEIPSSVTSIGYDAFRNCSSLTSIVIPNSVTSIGYEAFYGCSSLTNIEIPNSVTSIEDYTFSGCSSLINITIPDGVTSIWNDAFYGCSSLKNIDIPSSVTRISNNAFEKCSSLTNIVIPNSVTSINGSAFSCCSSLRQIMVDSANMYYTSIDGVLYNKEKTEVLKYPNGRNEDNYVIPNGVISIGDGAFYKCSSLTNIEIPNSVISIGYYAFSECNSLTNIEIPNSVTSIGNSAFRECRNLTNIEMSNSVTSIGSYAFYDSIKIKNINIPSSVTSIGDYAFFLTEAIITCKTNSEAHKYLEERGIAYILLDNEEPIYGIDYQIKDEIWDISKNGDESLIAQYTVNNRTLIISGSGTMNNDSVKEAWMSSKYDCYIEKVIIEEGVTEICNEAFRKCRNLSSIEIPSSVTHIGGHYFGDVPTVDEVFSDCINLKEIKINSNNLKYMSVDGVLFMRNGALLLYPLGREETEYIIPNFVTVIGDNAFTYCSSLKNIEIPSGVTSIRYSAFEGCSSLTNIEIPSSVISIGSSTFEGCSSLTNIEIPNSVTSIEEYVFAYCGSLTNITIPDSVTSIEKYAFSGCRSLTNIEIPNSVTSIENGVFDNCRNLTNIEIPNSVTSIGDNVFNNCDNLLEIRVNEGNNFFTDIDGVLYNKEKTKLIKYPTKKEKVIYIIPNSVTSIGDGAFNNCRSLTNIVIPNSITSIQENTFKYIKGTIICKTNSEAHRYAESEKIGYLLDEELPAVELTPNEFNQAQKQVSIKVDVSDTITGVDENNIKYLWSTKTEVSKDEFETSFENGSQINSPENATGIYYLYIYAEDKVGNEVIAKSNAIRLDNTPPQIKGVENGKKYYGKAKPIVTDNNPIVVELTKDGNKVTTYTNGAEITEIGEYKITATDEAGNSTEIGVEFEIEKIPDGQDGINYVLEPSELTNQDVKVTLSKKDATKYADLKIQISTDGENYEDGTEKTVKQNGKIYARYAIDELAGVPLEIEVTNIDKTVPETEVTYSTTELTKENVLATITANEKVQNIEGWTKSADEKVLTKEYEQNTATEGEKIVVKDLVGNETETIVKIANIDKVAPTVTGVQNGRSYSKRVTPVVEDENLESVILVKKEKKQNEEEIIETEVEGYKNGDEITELGDYKLTATDKVGNTTIVEFSIKEIPDTKDVVVVTKSTEELTNQDVVVTITKKDREEYEDLKVEVSTDNENYEEQTTNPSTKTLTENGKIYVRVVKEDVIGEVLEVEVNNIDKTGPTLNVSYSTTELTNDEITVTITSNEKIQEVEGWELSNDGMILTKEYSKNTKETVIVKDQVGNEATANIKIENIKIRGDLNGNNKIDISDLLVIYRHISQKNNPKVAEKHPDWNLSDEKILQGDINNNKKLDIGDVLKIQRYISATNSAKVAQAHPDWLEM